MTTDNTPKKDHRNSGFSLFEVTIVLVILSVVLTGLLPFLTESMQSNAANITVERMNAIDKALKDYADTNAKLPCPADPTELIKNGPFGRADVACAVTWGGNNWSVGGATGVIGGMIPTKDLFLPDEYAFDGWGRRIAYHVSKKITEANGISESDGSVIVQDAAATNRTAVAAYVIVSHGPNGHGGYTLSGARYNGESQNAHELSNCKCTSAGAWGGYVNLFFQHMEQYQTGFPDDRNYYFDDLVRFRMMAHFK